MFSLFTTLLLFASFANADVQSAPEMDASSAMSGVDCRTSSEIYIVTNTVCVIKTNYYLNNSNLS